jgi:carboxyl-terminal processing protease
VRSNGEPATVGGEARLLAPGWRSSYRLMAVVTAFLVVAASCSTGSAEDDAGGDAQPSTNAEAADDQVQDGLEEQRAYLEQAIALLQDRYHAADEVDWDEVQRTAHERLEGAPNRFGSYLAITAALEEIGDGHNRLIQPEAVQRAGADEPGRLPTVEHSGGLLTVTLPPVDLQRDTSAEYVPDALAAIRDGSASSTCGWVVDLRDFTGGSMFHPLAVLGPILAGQQALTLEHRDGAVVSAVEFAADGGLLLNGRPAAEALADAPVDGVLLPDATERLVQALTDLGPLPSPAPDMPVAVLTSSSTASAGEAVVVALEGRPTTRRFGSTTRGVPTGPVDHELEDGAILLVAETRMVDRNGNAYDTGIPPDLESTDPATDARTWLEDVGDCTP